jgi:hypothetical protein
MARLCISWMRNTGELSQTGVQYKIRTHRRVIRTYIPIPFLFSRIPHSTRFSFVIVLLFLLLLMAPRTRRSQTIETANNTLTLHSENQVLLENSTSSNITPKQRRKRHQNANVQGASKMSFR